MQEDKVGTKNMAKYIITYKCGHTATVQLYGKHAERQRKIAWYATIDCPDCQAEYNRKKAEESGLPQLTGSEKQIAWANRLRNDSLAILDAQISKLPEPNKSTATGLRNQWLQNETMSTYWIDRRFDLDNFQDITELIFISINQHKFDPETIQIKEQTSEYLHQLKGDLPRIDGIGDQVSWAINIRDVVFSIAKKGILSSPAEDQPSLCSQFKQWLEKETSAAYWIDNEFYLASWTLICEYIQNP